MPELICTECHKPYTADRYSSKFCSQSCAATHNNRGVRRHGTVPGNCPVCSIRLNSNRRKYLKSEELSPGTYHFTGSRAGATAFLIHSGAVTGGSGSLNGGGVVGFSNLAKSAVYEIPLSSIILTGNSITIFYSIKSA